MLHEVEMKPSSKQEWVAWVRRAEASGQSLSAFAAQHGLSRSGLYFWRQQVRAQPAPAANASTALAFVRLEAEATPPTGASLEVVLQNGRVIRVPAAFDAAALAKLLAVVDGGAR